MSRRKNPGANGHAESAIIWFFAGLLIIAAVAGLLGKVVSG